MVVSREMDFGVDGINTSRRSSPRARSQICRPIASPNANDSANNLCGVSPCTSGPHSVMTFSFRVPASGTFRWQCYIPCGGGYIDGNGGPMATPGYMMGQMEVQS